MKTTKESVFEFVQKQLMTNMDFKDGISTKVIAEYFQLQRSNVSTLLNELVKDNRLEKTNTRPVLYYLPQKEVGNELNTVGKADDWYRWKSCQSVAGCQGSYFISKQ